MHGTSGAPAADQWAEITAIRNGLRKRSQAPLPCHGKVPAMGGWNGSDYAARQLQDSAKGTVAERIASWARRFPTALTTGVRVENGLLVLDGDVNDEAGMAALMAAIDRIAPRLTTRAPTRSGSGTFKRALFCRVEGEAFVRFGSHKYHRPDEPPENYHHVEIFGGKPFRSGVCSRQFACYGPRAYADDDVTVTSSYGWAQDRPALHEVELADLPTLSREQALEIIGAFERWAEAQGWIRVETADEGDGEGNDIFDIEPATTRFEVRGEAATVGYAELEAMVFTTSDLRVGAFGSMVSVTQRPDRCSVFWSKRFGDCLVIKDWKTNNRHYPIDKAPTKDWSKTLLGDWLRDRRANYGDAGFAKPIDTTATASASANEGTGSSGAGASGSASSSSSPPPVTNLMQTSAEFVGGYVPPDYLIDGLLQRRYVYSLTAPTGAGKTSVALRIAAHVANGIILADREVEKGRALFFAGENPDDVRTRWIMLAEEMKLDPNSMDVVFMPFTIDLSEEKIRERIDLEAAHFGPFSLLIVDTSAAYYSGSDENDNVALGNHARMLRSFVNLPGGPTVLVTCHPTKTPNMENLLPRGGGAFLAEVDGNLVCIKDTSTMMVEVTTHGKFRGPDFAPFAFTLVAGQSDRLVDSKGRKVWSIFARPISSETQERIEENKNDAQDHVLYAMVKCQGLSLLQYAEKLRWKTMDGKPNKPRVHRHMKVLQKAPYRLVEQLRNGKYILTAKGKKEADKVAAEIEGTDRVPDEWK